MLKLLCKYTRAGGQVLQNEENRSSVPGCLRSGEHLCRVVAGSPAPECGELQCWHQSCYYCFQLQTALIFAIHYWKCVFSACQVLVSQEVWSQLDWCQQHTCYGASNRLRFLGSMTSRQTYMDGKVLLLKLPEGTQISSISTLCVVAILLDHSRGRPERGFPDWSHVCLCCDENLAPLIFAHLLIQGSRWFLSLLSLAMPFPLLLLLPAGWNASQLSLLFNLPVLTDVEPNRSTSIGSIPIRWCYTSTSVQRCSSIYFFQRRCHVGRKKGEKSTQSIRVQLGTSPATPHGSHHLGIIWVQTFTLLLWCWRCPGPDLKEDGPVGTQGEERGDAQPAPAARVAGDGAPASGSQATTPLLSCWLFQHDL